MFDKFEEEYSGYEPLDGCFGQIVGTCRKGAFLTLDNGQEAFAYHMANLRIGSKVLCTVLKLPRDERKMLVCVDSVIEYAVPA